MFDINKIINDTIAAAVSTHITTLQQEYANKMAEMAQQIAALDTHLAEAIDRIAALENQALVEHDAVDARIAALENNPAQGVDTTLEQRIAALETKLTEADLFTKTTEVHINKDELLEYLDNQEWFWGKIRRFADGVVESAVEQHCEKYDHDDFVTGDKLDDYVQKDSFRDEIEDVLNNATVRIRF